MTPTSAICATLTTTLWALSTTLAAVDAPPAVRDMRLLVSGGFDSGEYTSTFDEDSSAFPDVTVGPTETKLNYRASLIFVGSIGSTEGFGAPVVGISFNQMSFDTASARSLQSGYPSSTGRGTATMFGLHGGWAISLTRGWHIEATAHIAYGGFTGEETISGTLEDDSDITTRMHSTSNGYYFEYGLTAAMAYTFHSGLQLIAQIAYINGEGSNSLRQSNEFRLDFAHVDSEYDISNVIPSLGFGFRF